jgi:hypothetical protein
LEEAVGLLGDVIGVLGDTALGKLEPVSGALSACFSGVLAGVGSAIFAWIFRGILPFFLFFWAFSARDFVDDKIAFILLILNALLFIKFAIFLANMKPSPFMASECHAILCYAGFAIHSSEAY